MRSIRCKSLFACSIVVAGALGGCRTFTDPARGRQQKIEVGSAGWIDNDATRRSTLLFPKDSNVKVLAEPPPDVAMATVADLMAKLNFKGIDASASAKITETIVELGDKTQTVMILRELLFRLSEMSVNGTIEPDKQIEMYGKVLDATKALVEADKAKSEEKAQEARKAADEARSERIELESRMRGLQHDNRFEPRLDESRRPGPTDPSKPGDES